MSEHRPPAHTPLTPPQEEPWAELRALTAARIALPRSGASLATAPQLDLRLAHARARDAVHAQLDEARLVEELAPLALPVLAVASAAADRQHYLMRPDLGRRLAGDAEARLAAHAGSGHDVAVLLIGERPGLSAPDSMGAYLTFRPTPQTTDADRNCISNIRPEGLAYADAAVTLTHLLRAMRARQISGVRLKDDRLLLDGG